MTLSEAQKKHLRGLGHKLKPVVMVGDAGLSAAVYDELESALDHHELIKVKLRSDRLTRKSQSYEIASNCKATIVHQIGQVTCFYRHNAEKPVIELPKK